MTKKFSIIVVLTLTLWLGGFILFTAAINSYRIDENTPTQAIIALTGGRNRISEAVRLLNGGLSERLFISGVGKKISLTEISRTQHLHIARQEGQYNANSQQNRCYQQGVQTALSVHCHEKKPPKRKIP